MITTYAGVNLPRATVEYRRLFEQKVRPHFVDMLATAADKGARREYWTFIHSDLRSRPITLDSVYWPTGAMNFAVAYFLVPGDKLDEIKKTTADTGTSVSALLKWGEVGEQLSSLFYMLPAIPLCQIEGGERDLYLLTLVDERFFWWFKENVDIDISTACNKTWAELYTSIGTALGVSIQTGVIEAAYLKPCHRLSSFKDPLPQLLDTVAYNTGRRIIRSLTGVVTAQTVTQAETANDTLAAEEWSRASGGTLALPSGSEPALILPAKVVVRFPRPCNLTGGYKWYDKEVSLSTLALTDPGILGYSGAKIFHDTALGAGIAATPTNSAQLDTLAIKIATDWYGWQLGRVQAVYNCVKAVEPHGLIDHIEWVDDGQGGIFTKVCRPVWNDLAEELLHCGSGGCLDDCDEKEICGRAEVKALTAGCIKDRSDNDSINYDWVTNVTVQPYNPTTPSKTWTEEENHVCGRAEIQSLVFGCVVSRGSGNEVHRQEICGRAEIKSLVAGCVEDPTAAEYGSGGTVTYVRDTGSTTNSYVTVRTFTNTAGLWVIGDMKNDHVSASMDLRLSMTDKWGNTEDYDQVVPAGTFADWVGTIQKFTTTARTPYSIMVIKVKSNLADTPASYDIRLSYL